jgi:hypothetical protein
MAETRVFTYLIDESNRISYVSPEWLEFAIENGAQQLVLPGVLGKPLWPFIADLETMQLYQEILKKVRSASVVICFPFRCDAPQLRRFMEMIVRPRDVNSIEFNSRVVREEPREPVPLLAPTMPRSDRLIRMCGWCKRVATPEWLEIEEAIPRLRLFEQDAMPRITHGICEDCKEQIVAAIP